MERCTFTKIKHDGWDSFNQRVLYSGHYRAPFTFESLDEGILALDPFQGNNEDFRRRAGIA